MTAPLSSLPGKVSALTMFIGEGRRDSVMDAALVTKDEFLKGPPRVGLPRNASLSWGAGFEIKGTSNPTALVSYRGPVHWWESGTGPHIVTPKGFRGSRRSRTARAASTPLGARTGNRLSQAKVGRGASQALRFPDGNVRRTAFHPGMRARPFFHRVKANAAPAATRTVQSGLRRNIARAGFGAVA